MSQAHAHNAPQGQTRRPPKRKTWTDLAVEAQQASNKARRRQQLADRALMRTVIYQRRTEQREMVVKIVTNAILHVFRDHVHSTTTICSPAQLEQFGRGGATMRAFRVEFASQHARFAVDGHLHPMQERVGLLMPSAMRLEVESEGGDLGDDHDFLEWIALVCNFAPPRSPGARRAIRGIEEAGAVLDPPQVSFLRQLLAAQLGSLLWDLAGRLNDTGVPTLECADPALLHQFVELWALSKC